MLSKKDREDPSRENRAKLSKTCGQHPCTAHGGKPKVKRQTTHTPFNLKVRRKGKKRLSTKSYKTEKLKEFVKEGKKRDWPIVHFFGDVPFF